MGLIGAVGSFFFFFYQNHCFFFSETCQVTIGKPQSTHKLQICNGYLIDAATITECLHTCKSMNLHDFPIDLVSLID